MSAGEQQGNCVNPLRVGSAAVPPVLLPTDGLRPPRRPSSPQTAQLAGPAEAVSVLLSHLHPTWPQSVASLSYVLLHSMFHA